MNDTHPKMAKKFREMMAAKTGSERLVMGCDMHETSKKIVESAILHEYPQADRAFLRKQIFLRFYGHEFSEQQREKIISWLSSE